jgi:mercuric ion transport protein
LIAMNDAPASTKPGRAPGPGRETGALLLTVGGLAAAFGAASCCALPMLLASVGLSSAWLLTVAWLAAPHRIALLAAAILLLAGGGGLLFSRRRGAACMLDRTGTRAITIALGAGILSVAAVLTALGFLFA